MKKIFAFVLASIMVLSLVPASVFAALTKCPDTHTVNNCAYTIVDEQTADCTQPGFKACECKECGERFLTDLVQQLPHEWQDDPAKKDKNEPANCETEEDGWKYEVCKNCKLAEKHTIEWETSHKLGTVSGFGCEAAAKCSVCDGKFTGKKDSKGHYIATGTHNFQFTKITEEPAIVNGVADNGEALYTCKTCKETKTVPVFAPSCRCDGFWDIYCTEIVPAKAANCLEKGTLAVYKCDDCNQLYSYDKSKKGAEAWTEIKKIEEAELDALGHTAKDKNKTTVGCTTTYKCERKGCGAEVEEKDHAASNSYVLINEDKKNTCVDYGFVMWLCNSCGDKGSEFDEPTGHTEKSFHVDATCAKYGYTVYYCANEECHIFTTSNVGTKNNPTEKYTIYGETYDVSMKDEDGKTVGVQVLRVLRDEAPNASAHDYECIFANPVACGVPGYEVYKCKNCGFLFTKNLPAIEHKFDEEKTEYTAPSCTQAGTLKQWCNNCQQYVIRYTQPATPGQHNYEKVEIHSNCSNNVPASYYKNGIAYHTWEKYQCTGCDAFINVYSNPVNSSKVQTTFNSLEEAELYHYGAAYLVNGEWVYSSEYDNFGEALPGTMPSTCYSNGSALYQCGYCTQIVHVSLEKALHDDNALIYHKAKAATCTANGNIAYYTCYKCNGIVLKDENGKQKTVTLADTVLLPHTQELDEVIVEDCAGNVIGSYWICNQKDSKGKLNCKKLFTDDTASVKYTGKTKAEAAKDVWTTIVAYKAATCNTPGVVGIEYCATCGKVRISENYIANNGKKKTEPFDSIEDAEKYALKSTTTKIDIIVSANNTVTANTIEIPMFDHAYNAKTGEYEAIKSETTDPAKDCSKPGYTYNKCSLCPYEFLDEYKPAASTKGHENKYGQSLKGDCGYLEGLKDRKCFYCGITVEPNHKNLVEAEGVEYTCESDGYTYKYCADCNMRVDSETVINFANADAYHDALDENGKYKNRVTVGVVEDYANNGEYYTECPVCHKVFGEKQKENCPGVGLEVILSADADEYIAGATVKVTVTLDSLKGVNVWGLSIPVTYDPDEFKYIGYELNTDVFGKPEVYETKFNNTDSKGNILNTTTSSGVISITGAASENVMVKGALDLVTLEFMVITPVADEYSISVVESVKDVQVATIKNPSTGAAAPVKKDFALNFVNEKGVAVANVLYKATEEVLDVNVKGFLNIDGDKAGLINMSDALALYEYIVFGPYNVEADVNCDGTVDISDLIFLFDIINGKKTVQEYIYSIVK